MSDYLYSSNCLDCGHLLNNEYKIYFYAKCKKFYILYFLFTYIIISKYFNLILVYRLKYCKNRAINKIIYCYNENDPLYIMFSNLIYLIIVYTITYIEVYDVYYKWTIFHIKYTGWCSCD